MILILLFKFSSFISTLILIVSAVVLIFFEIQNWIIFYKYKIILNWQTAFNLNKPFTLINLFYSYKEFKFLIIFLIILKIVKFFLMLQFLIFICFILLIKLKILNSENFFLNLYKFKSPFKFILLNPLALILIFKNLNYKEILKILYTIFTKPAFIDIPYIFLLKTSRWAFNYTHIIMYLFINFYKNKKIYKNKKDFFISFFCFIEKKFSNNIKTVYDSLKK